MVVEDAPGSRTAVKDKSPHFPVLPEFANASYLKRYDISSLKALWLAGEPLDEPTATWISQAINKPKAVHTGAAMAASVAATSSAFASRASKVS
jgi:hypothetical protein